MSMCVYPLYFLVDSLNLKTHNRPEIKENSVLQLDSSNVICCI